MCYSKSFLSIQNKYKKVKIIINKQNSTNDSMKRFNL